MGRTKYEIDALTDTILSEILKQQRKKLDAVKPKAKALYKSKYAPLLKKRTELEKKADAIAVKIKKDVYKVSGKHYVPSSLTEERIVEQLSKEFAKLTFASRQEIENKVILAGDQGADILIKNITKMFI